MADEVPQDTAARPDPLVCAHDALTCIRAYPSAGQQGGAVPLTFGLPFAPGRVQQGQSIEAKLPDGTSIPVQMDETATNPDHSLGFAVLSMTLPRAPRSGEIVSLFVGGPAPADTANVAAALSLAEAHDTRVVLNIYSDQITKIVPGNRVGFQQGTPFRVGDKISLHLGDDPADVYSLTIGPKQAGGGFGTLKEITIALMNLINKGPHFKAYRVWEELYVTPRTVPAPPFKVAIDSTAQAPIKVETEQAYAAPARYVASSRDMLADAVRTGKVSYWLAGPVAREYMVSGPLIGPNGVPHPRLTAHINIRVYAGTNVVRTDVAVEDTWSYRPGARNWQYNAEIDEDGKAVFQATNVVHYSHSRWHRIIWSDGRASPYVRFDPHYLLNSRALPHYDETLNIPASVINEEAGQLAKSDTNIMGNALVTQYYGMTGGRADIGPLPRWTVLYLLTMDPTAFKVMMANGDASGSVPIHYRDDKTGHVLNIDEHPGVVLNSWPPADPKDALPAETDVTTPWQPDEAHQPSLVFVPYMVTGDEYYLEEIEFWANWNIGALAPGTRERAKGIVVQQIQQRGQAWSLRAVGDAAWITPDQDPMKAYFEDKLANNIKFALDHYDQRSNPIGLDAVFIDDDHFGPWQMDFLSLSVATLAEHGYPGAETWLRWLSEVDVGRFNNEKNGYCRMDGPAYYIKMRSKPGQPLFTSWSQITAASFPNQTACPTTFPHEAYDGSTLGYVANAMASMAAQADLNIPDARETYEFLNERETRVSFIRDPTWRIVPR